MLRKLLLAATVLAAPLAIAGTAAAQPVTGLYIGAGGGANFMERQQVRVSSSVPGLPNRFGYAGFDTGYVALGSVGLGVRQRAPGRSRRRLPPQRLWASAGLPPYNAAREEKYGGMVNALFDLDIGSPYIYPYIGGGAGYQHIDQRGFTDARPARGRFRRKSEHTDNAFAYQAIAGLSVPIPPVVGLSLTAEYRLLLRSRRPRVLGAEPRRRSRSAAISTTA